MVAVIITDEKSVVEVLIHISFLETISNQFMSNTLTLVSCVRFKTWQFAAKNRKKNVHFLESNLNFRNKLAKLQ